jgi:amino acid transporter
MLLQFGYPIGLAATVVFLGSWVNSFVPALNWIVVAVAAVVLITPLVLRGVVVPTIWCFVFFSIEAVGLVVLSIAVLFMAGGHIQAPFTNLGGCQGLEGSLSRFPLPSPGISAGKPQDHWLKSRSGRAGIFPSPSMHPS